MNKLQGKVEIKKAEGKITVIASDETLDRHGEVIPLESWMLESFRGSPRMLVDHDHRVEKIVGRWDNARVENGKLLMDAVFHELTPLSKATKEMVEGGFLDTVSVGFIPHEIQDETTHQLSAKNELIETSWVTVPANPSARVLKELGEKTITAEEQAAVDKWLGVEKEVEAPKPLEAEKEEPKPAVKSVEEFNSRKESEPVMLCEAQFIEQLISAGEKQKTLTGGEGKSKKVVASDKVLHIALKEVARLVNDSLRIANKQ